MTRGGAAAPGPIDIGAVSRSGELFDALAARRPADPGDDTAVRLLAALVADVDVGAPPLPAPARVSRAKAGSRRRAVRVVVTIGVTAAVLTTAGAAAAGGGAGGDRSATDARSPRVHLLGRTDGSLQLNPPGRPAGRRFAVPEPRRGARHRDDDDHQAHSSRPEATERQRSHHDHDSDDPDVASESRQSSGDAHERRTDPPRPSPPSADTEVPLPEVQP